MTAAEVRGRAEEFVARLEDWNGRQERGVLARLRRGLSDTTRQEAWTVLGPRFGPITISNPVYVTVGGCFALYPLAWQPLEDPREDARRNLGWTFREVRLDQPGGAEKMSSEKEPHATFRRVLACSGREEICKHVLKIVRLAKSRGKDVNYRQLFQDLWWWNKRTKANWAMAYWSVPAEAAGFTLAGLGALVGEEPLPAPE